MVHFPAIRPIAWCTFHDSFRIIFCSPGRFFQKKIIEQKIFQTRSRSHVKIFKCGAFAMENVFAKKKYLYRIRLIPVPAPVPVEVFSRFTCDHNREIFFSSAIMIAQKNFQTR